MHFPGLMFVFGVREKFDPDDLYRFISRISMKPIFGHLIFALRPKKMIPSLCWTYFGNFLKTCGERIVYFEIDGSEMYSKLDTRTFDILPVLENLPHMKNLRSLQLKGFSKNR